MILFPATIAQFSNVVWLQQLSAALTPPSTWYVVLTVVLIFFFAYFYTAIIFNPMDVAENLRKYGGFIPGRRPGRPTADFIDRTLSRLTFLGAIYLSAIVILPTYLTPVVQRAVLLRRNGAFDCRRRGGGYPAAD